MTTINNPTRCEVQWHFYDKTIKKHVTRWLPAVLLHRRDSDGRCEVRTDCGKHALDAAPECVRETAVSAPLPV